jgi:hypothetical protein
MLFSLTDERDLRERGLTSAELMNTIYRFTHQTQPVHLDRPCTTGDGITILKASEANHYLSIFETESQKKTIMKFVPASGAASRMFKHIYQYHPENIDQLTEEFIINIDLFPFFNLLKEEFSKEGNDGAFPERERSFSRDSFYRKNDQKFERSGDYQPRRRREFQPRRDEGSFFMKRDSQFSKPKKARYGSRDDVKEFDDYAGDEKTLV